MARTRQRNTSAIVIARALIQRYGQSCVPGDRRRVHPAVAMRDIFNAVGLQLELNRDRLPCGAFRTCKNTGPELVPAIVFGCESDNWELAGVAVDVTENVMADNRLEKDLKVSVIPGRQVSNQVVFIARKVLIACLYNSHILSPSSTRNSGVVCF